MSETSLITKETLIAKGTQGWDVRKKGKAIIIAAGLGVAGYFLLPILAAMAWSAVSLTIASVILFAIIGIVTNKKFQRRMGYFLDIFNNILFGWIVSMDPFVIQEGHIEDAEKESQNMLAKKDQVEQQYQRTIKDIEEEKRNRIKASKSMQLALKDGNDEYAKSFGNEVTRADQFIQVMEPMANDMKFIIEFSTEVHKSIVENIKEAKLDLRASKRLYESAMTSSAVLSSARKAFFGDSTKNAELEAARENIKNKIALSVGQMRTSMEVLNEAMTKKNYNDKAKFEMMKEQLLQINPGVQPVINIDQFQSPNKQTVIIKKNDNNSDHSFHDLFK